MTIFRLLVAEHNIVEYMVEAESVDKAEELWNDAPGYYETAHENQYREIIKVTDTNTGKEPEEE